MITNEPSQKEDTRSILERLRDFVKQGGPHARENVRFYLRMCLKAEELRQQGWQVTIRGERQRWVVVIEGNQSLEKLLRPTPRTRLRKVNSQRKTSFIFCRN